MYNIQGIISKTVNNTETQLERLGYISTNIANLNTNGYKDVRFEQIMKENGYLDTALRTDFSVGKMYRTKRPLDVAIDGYGFVPVTNANGEIAYTRDCSFKIGKDGYLFNMRGDLVGDGIQIPVNIDRLEITPEGKINVYLGNSEKPKTIGTIPLVYFNNPEGLQNIGGNKFIATENSGEPMLQKEHNFFKQGFVESTNTDIYTAISDIMRINTSTLASYQIIGVVDKMYERGINLTDS